MDNNIEHLKQNYAQIPIPEELDMVVKKAIRQSRAKRTNLRWIIGTAAAVIVFVSSVNSSPAIANAFSSIPVLDKIVKVITFREFTVNEDTYNANLKIPAVTNLGNKPLEDRLNTKYLEENKKLYAEFQHEMDEMKKQGDGGHLGVDTGYEVKTDNDQILAIGRYVVNTVGSSSTTMKYDTIDKKNEVLITLPSLFKDDSYIALISENIKQQMLDQMKANPDKAYWVKQDANDTESMDIFEAIQKDQSFYINNEGKLVISFDKYEVAPGSEGIVEFVIPTDKIASDLVSHEYIK